MIAWLLSFLSGPLLSKIFDAYKLRLEAKTTTEAKAVELAQAEIMAEIASRQAAKEIIIAEQGRWYTAIIRPLFALPFIIYIWKLVVWDKVFKWGATDALGDNLTSVMMTIIACYFGGRTIEKVAQIFKR
jgi:hypothetical protein